MLQYVATVHSDLVWETGRCDPSCIFQDLSRLNIHKNARLTFARRQEMVLDVTEHNLTYAATAADYGVSVPTARKWVGRYLTQGEAGLCDASSRTRSWPTRSI
ncbi:MAG TPA: leucine zipper domain-containing protein [Casimicrobiaceae bacterium]|nr:leucine zipper domain-containing protein [Casimicrobiaceae bacterium]